MRTLRSDLRHGALVILIMLGAAMAAVAGVTRTFPALRLPWLTTLLLIVIVDAVLTQRIVVRQRLTLIEQGGLRGVEWLLILVVVRVISLAGEGQSLRTVLEPWLRDPLAVFSGRFFAYLLPSMVAWAFTVLLVNAALYLEAEPPQHPSQALPNDIAAALEERSYALKQFDTYWVINLLLALGGVGLALYRVSIREALLSWATLVPLIGMLMCAVAGLVLHSYGQLEHLQYGWQLSDSDVAPDVTRRWRRSSALVVAVAAVLGLLLSSVLMLAPPPPLIPIVNALLILGTLIIALVLLLMAILLLPFAWLFSLLSGSPPPTIPTLPEIPPPQIEQGTSERPLLPALIFWACVLLLIGVAALRYWRARSDVGGLLRRWPRLQRFLQWIGGWWGDVRDWGALAIETARARLRRRARRGTVRRIPPPGAHAQMEALYRRLIEAAKQRGVAHPRSQTPYELRTAIQRELPSADRDLSGLTDVYVRTEYGPQPPQPTDVRTARAHWQRLQRAFRSSRRGDKPALRRKR